MTPSANPPSPAWSSTPGVRPAQTPQPPVVVPWARSGDPAPSAGSLPSLPRVALIGDSIRIGYAPFVVEALGGKAEVVQPAENGGDSANVLAHLNDWLTGAQPGSVELVHLNCGLHDLKRSRADGSYQVPLAQYEANLRQIVQRIRQQAHVALVFATTTPIHDARHATRKVDFDRFQEDVARYNATALRVMRELDVPVHDLHWVVENAGTEDVLGQDGTHYTPEGYRRLAEAVADTVLRHLTITRYRPMAAPAAGPDAAARYRAEEAARDAAVPPAYAGLQVPELPQPRDAPAWQAQRPGVRETVLRTLGDLPPRPGPAGARVVSREARAGYTLERVALDNGVDGEVSALVLVPEGLRAPAPAVLWLHSSTPDKTQAIIPHTNGGEAPIGEALVRRGYVVLAPDAYWHGNRMGSGPSGAFQTWREEQESLFKYHLWLGRTLWGMFVRDDQVALDYLCSRPEVDASRIGATGMSMGSTRAWWLAAVDDRVTATVAVACLTRYQNLIRHGQLRQHGIYYFVNGLLNHFDVEGVLSLIAPRPFLALTGDLDAGSPADGVRDIEQRLGAVYAALDASASFRSVLYPDTGHTVTPQMRAETLAWFDRWLQSPSPGHARSG